MAFDPLSTAIAVGGNIIGGLFGADQQRKNREFQEQMANTSVQRRVADAKAAGVHPLAALGATTFTPAVSAFSPMGDALQKSGQDISRAMMAGQSSEGQAATKLYTEQFASLQLENMKLQNDALRSRIARLNQPGGAAPPGIPGGSTSPGDIPGMDPKGPSGHKGITIGGDVWPPPDKTSTGQDVEDEVGEDSPLSWYMNTAIAYEWVKRKYGPPQAWPRETLQWAWQNARNDLINDLRPLFEGSGEWVRGRRNAIGEWLRSR